MCFVYYTTEKYANKGPFMHIKSKKFYNHENFYVKNLIFLWREQSPKKFKVIFKIHVKIYADRDVCKANNVFFGLDDWNGISCMQR